MDFVTLVGLRSKALPIANDVESRDVELGVEARRQVDILQERRMVAQQQQAEPLVCRQSDTIECEYYIRF